MGECVCPPDKQPDVTASFDVGELPTPMLIDPNGRVVELGNDLREEALLRTLSKLLVAL